MKKCPQCEKMNNAYAGICEFCGADISWVLDGGNETEETPEHPEKEQDLENIDAVTDITDTDVGATELTDIYNQLEEIKGHLSRGSTLSDVNMPFGRMVMLFIKVILAAIPAIMMVGFLFFLFWAFFGGLLFNVFFRGYGMN